MATALEVWREVTRNDDANYPPLAKARTPEHIRLLVQFGVNPNDVGRVGTALMGMILRAVEGDDTLEARVDALLDVGADINAQCQDVTALSMAIYRQRLDMVRCLMARGATTPTPMTWVSRSLNGAGSMDRAARAVVKDLVRAGTPLDPVQLVAAIRNSSWSIALFWLDVGVDPGCVAVEDFRPSNRLPGVLHQYVRLCAYGLTEGVLRVVPPEFQGPLMDAAAVARAKAGCPHHAGLLVDVPLMALCARAIRRYQLPADELPPPLHWAVRNYQL